MSVSIILVAPQMGENIGATARAMKNFGLADLRIVNPRDGWPNDKAIAMSVGARDLIERAQIFNSITEAIKDLEYVYATTATPRNMNKSYVLAEDLATDLSNRSNVGIMFGMESTGLSNEDIVLANKIVTIETVPDFSSLNIAHAVAVLCYQIFGKEKIENNLQIELATHEDLNHFYDNLFGQLENTNFFKSAEKRPGIEQKIRNIFTRIDQLSTAEIQTLHGIIKALSK